MGAKTEEKQLSPETPGSTLFPGDGTSTQEPSINLEKGSSHSIPPPNDAPAEYVRPISNTAWAFVCVGLFLSALLYGKM